MSLTDTTLGDFVDATEAERDDGLDVMVGARYGRGGGNTSHERPPADAGQCRHCEAEIDREVQRVVGDAHGRVPLCIDCAADVLGVRGEKFATTTSVVMAVRDRDLAASIPSGER
jgi:hypothetical protein